MAACTKVAAFGAILRVLYVAFGDHQWDWRPLIYGVAIVSMVVGAVLGLTQTDLKRMLAYSSIAHAGFLLVGVIAVDRAGLSATMFYLLVYGLTTLGAFAAADPGPGRRRRGEPPVAVGGSGQAFAGDRGGLEPVPALAGRHPADQRVHRQVRGVPGSDRGRRRGRWSWSRVLTSAVAAFYYLRVIVLMYFSPRRRADGPTVGVPGLPTTVVLAITATATLVLGIVPGPVLDLAREAARFVG